ncbi:hypothetical protein SAMN05444411_10379 [Lutibacter oricola]|uniref:Uncharacterized protein n=1 Tax=Lutibacter oricola TaxID=762486 RepID=A0A1H2YW29_9FLAO|nr:hypothetical protein [Lutibacter oricola]SDX09392.1 hypothetical protein SAMN05444411_10379 [Lutibacter oricola]
MNLSQRITATSLRATITAIFLNWSLNILCYGKIQKTDLDDLPIVFAFFIISSIIISVICYISVILTIVPFYKISITKFNPKEIFKRYFPYYAIVSFVICTGLAFNMNIIEPFIINFIITVFLTSVTSWIWFFKK